MQRLRFGARSAFRVALAIAIGLLLWFVVVPYIAWAWNIERAGRLLDSADRRDQAQQTLPALASIPLSAGPYLESATHWRSNHPYAFRLLAQMLATDGKWDAAITAIERARVLAPGDPLVAWESALVYEGALEAAAAAPRENILADLISGRIEAPLTSINTSYCEPYNPRACYIALDSYTQPYAELANGVPVQQDVLFMYPPSSASITREIFASHPALRFMLALDPNMADSRSDGATFQVWLSSASEEARLVYERSVDRASAAQGWIPDWVDLSPWAGQTVTLTLQTTGGPSGDTADDWYAWGAVQLTTVEAARPERRSLDARLLGAWRDAGVDHAELVHRGDVLLGSQPALAVTWYRRAERLGQAPSFPLAFRQAVGAVVSRSAPAARWLQLARQLDPGFAPFVVEDRLRLDGNQLRWLRHVSDEVTYGVPLSKTSTVGTAGPMWWSGAVVAAVELQQAGTYKISAELLHGEPGPIEMLLAVDDQPAKAVTLARADDTWEVVELPIILDAGPHVVSIAFTNDDSASGIDRDAVVNWIELERLSD